MYPSDFEAADAVFTPTQDDLFLGLPPLLALILFLLLLAIAAGMFFLGRWHADQSGSGSDRAPEDIHKEILKASTDALGASSNEIMGRAQNLRDVIWRRLGPVIELSKGITGPLKALDEALAGKVKVPPKPAADKPKVQDKPAHACTCGKPHACACPPAPPAVPAGPVTINQVYVGGSPIAQAAPPASPACGCNGPHKPGCHVSDPPPPPPVEKEPEERTMSRSEQIDAVSRAIRQFHDHWSNGPERIRELRAARKALS